MKNHKGIYLDSTTNKYYVSTTFTDYSGKSIKKCKRGFKTIREAELWKSQTALEISKSVGNKALIKTLISQYIATSNCKPRSNIVYRTTLLRAFNGYLDISIDKLNQNDLEAIYVEIKHNLSPKSINQYLNTTLAFLKWCLYNEFIQLNLFNRANLIFKKSKDVETPFKPILEENDFKNFVEIFNDNEIKLIVKVILFTGVRKGEALAFTRDDLNVNDNVLTISKNCIHIGKRDKDLLDNYIFCKTSDEYIVNYTKTNSIKYISIPNWLTLEINGWFNNNPDYEYFMQHIKYDSFTHVFNKVCKSNGYDITIHSLRHSHITMLYDMGCSGKYVAERVGHASEDTSLKIYNHITTQRKLKCDEIVSKLKL